MTTPKSNTSIESQINDIEKFAKQTFLDNGMEWFVKNHIIYVERLALKLADMKYADKNIIRLSVWLHDIGHRQHYVSEKHHIDNSEFAVKLLTEKGFDKSIIKSVEHCILTHRCKDGYFPETLEAKILASADAMSHIDNFSMLLFSAFILKKFDKEKAYNWLNNKIERDWNSKILIPEGKDLVKEKYDEVQLILKEMEESR
jgi:HD superfamily phosphodiesterase